MPSRWDLLDASKEVEQTIAKELKGALEPRGFEVVHNGSASFHAAGGRADIEVRASDKSILILVEVTKRVGAAAEGEFVSTLAHMDALAEKAEYGAYLLLFSAPSIGARLRKSFLGDNRERAARAVAGRSFVLDFAGLELVIDQFAGRDPQLYPASRWLNLLEERVWSEASDDTQAREVIARELFEEEQSLLEELSEETRREHALLEQQLKKKLLGVENKLRDKGITGNEANRTLIYLTFMRLYEEKRAAATNRMTSPGFAQFVKGFDAKQRKDNEGNVIGYLLDLIRSEDDSLDKVGLLANADGTPVRLHRNVTDDLVRELVFPVLDEYEFIGSRVDILGVVFETFAGRAEKDTRVGQFFTPEEVVKFGTALAEVHPRDQVLDPAVGTGRFLISAMEEMLRRVDEDASASADSIRQNQLHGVDLDDWVATIAKMNMYIHGDGKSNISAGNGLVVADRGVLPQWEGGVQGNIDVVLTNPPLGDVNYTYAATEWMKRAKKGSKPGEFLKNLGIVPVFAVEQKQLNDVSARRAALDVEMTELLESGSPTKKALTSLRRRQATADAKIVALTTAINAGKVTWRADGVQMKGGALFIGAIEQYLTAESPNRMSEPIEWRGGRVVLVVDEAVLNTPAYGFARSFIRTHFFVKAVVSLGRSAFEYLAHTDAKTSILYLVKKPNTSLAQQEPVFFGHADRVGFDRKGEWVGSDLGDILEAYEQFRDVVKTGYTGANYRSEAVEDAVASLGGHGIDWHTHGCGANGERLDYFHARRTDLEGELEERYGASRVALGELIAPATQETPAPSRTGEYAFASIERNTAMLRPKGTERTKYSPRDLWEVRENQLVVSGIDLVHGAVAVAGADVDGMVMSKEMFPYDVRDDTRVLPEYVALVLRTPQMRAIIEGLVTGTSNRTRLSSPEEILSLRIPPLPSIEDQKLLVATLREAHESYRRTWTLLEDTADKAEAIWGIDVAEAAEGPMGS
ncbi:MAG: N-6 DNA methylase [Actinomycetota bacterium]